MLEPRSAAIDAGSLDHELKFILPAARAALLVSSLGRVCQPDSRFPRGIVSSIYYDTAQLHLLHEKINSDYLKLKIRVRWYSDPETGEANGRAFAEAKSRIGTRRRKVRLETGLAAEWLDRQPLTRGSLVRIPEELRRQGIRLRGPLYPLITVRYERYRFLEPSSGARVAVDLGIRPAAVNPRFARPGVLRSLPVAVFEVKGKSRQLTGGLRLARAFGCRRASFSKLQECFAAATWGQR